MSWQDRMTVDPTVCRGKACIKGTRIMVAVVPDNLAVGVPIDELLRSYPASSREDIQAAPEYAAELTHERTVFLPSDAS